MRKYKKYAGADNMTPSVPQYFTWINNTNEGSTEKQTLINLEYFKWLRDTYGMRLGIYAWDAGNFDGAGVYGDTDSERFQKNYPNGWKGIAETARGMGVRLGLWGGPDGFGDTEKTKQKRFEFFVHLCRDYGFGEFKLDAVCGGLREDMADTFGEMLAECRRFCPELIVLNHRLEFYGSEKYATTFLWNGSETYTDVLICNPVTAMHNRAYMFSRGHVPGLSRLCEDHGVCISSCIDYFEDELVYQAFNRSLILAPEIYGNPWLMRDDEQATLARIYNLHAKNAGILVKGKLLPREYGANACSRGNGRKRWISTGNDTWETKRITLTLDASVGLENCGERFYVNLRHPYEYHIGEFDFGDSVEIELLPFRATLIEVSTADEADSVVAGCKYHTVREDADGVTDIRILQKESEPRLISCEKDKNCRLNVSYGTLEAAPVALGVLDGFKWRPENGEKLYEVCAFAADNDSLEARSLRRSGDTEIPQVKAAREAFFSQRTYKLRGCESAAMFDGRPDTFFDAQSRTYCGMGSRVKGGCLRVDFGHTVTADSIEIECFATATPTPEVASQIIPTVAQTSTELENWSAAPLAGIEKLRDAEISVVRFSVHDEYSLCGGMIKLTYKPEGAFRYLRIPEPPDRIYAVRLIKDGQAVKLENPRANNLQAPSRLAITQAMRFGEFTLPEYRDGARIAVAVNGVHGAEGVYCCAEIDGEFTGFPMRAPEYKANMWEHRVMDSDRNNTFFLPLASGLSGKKIKIYTLFNDRGWDECDCRVYLCDAHRD